MNIQTISQFELLDTELLATIDGGSKGVCEFVMAGANGYSCPIQMVNGTIL